MNKTELKALIGKFGKITGTSEGADLTLHGIIKDMDIIGTIWFVDNEGYGRSFFKKNVRSFEEMEFKNKSQ